MSARWRALAAMLAPMLAISQSQTPTGSIRGAVTDATGASIVAARVTVTHAGSGLVRQDETGQDGQFRLSGLPIGNYTLHLDKQGFAPVLIPEFPISVGQTVVHRIEMRPAEITERLEVRELPEALETAATTASVALGGDRIEEAPAQNRNYLNFVLLAPAVAPSSGSNAQRAAAGARNPVSDSGFSFGGMRGRNNSLSIDGADNRDETTGGNRVAIGLEMVQEFRVVSTSVGAELGGAAGGTLNVVTRSGTNTWHGDATLFAQTERFNARNPEVSSQVKPRVRRYQPGVSVNGPIRRDRTFFSTALEQEWESNEEWSESPLARLDEINGALESREFSGSGVRGGHRGLFPASSAQTEFSFKGNHQAGARHSLSARYAFSRGRMSHDVQDGDNFTDRSSRGCSLTQDHSLVGGWIGVPNPHFVNELRFQASRRTVGVRPNAGGPMLEIPGVLSLGQSYRLDADRKEDHLEFVDAVNVVLRGHQLSFGTSLHHVGLSARLANRFGGIFVFPTLESLLAAQPDIFIQAFGDPQTRLITVPVGAWVQDRWQPRPGLTVEAGLRYDRQWLPAAIPEVSRNVAPRLGVAWRPGSQAPYVFRLGTGLFYDRYPLAFLNEAVQKDGRAAFEHYLTGQDAVRAFSESRGGRLATPLAWAPRSTYQADRHFPATYSRKLTAGAERSLGANTTLTVEYSSVRGLHLPRLRNIAGTLPAAWQLEQTARSSHQGVSVSLHRRMSRDLAFLFAYNASRALDDASDYDEQPLDPFDPRKDWAHSRQHQPHRVAASALFSLPDVELGACPPWLRGALEDLILAPSLTAGRGRPINALDTTDSLGTGAYPFSARPAGLSRNPFYSHSTLSLDLRAMKGIWMKEHRAILQIGVEAFNLTNHSNPLRVSPYFAAGGRRLASYGQATETLNARQVQFLAQLEY